MAVSSDDNAVSTETTKSTMTLHTVQLPKILNRTHVNLHSFCAILLDRRVGTFI